MKNTKKKNGAAAKGKGRATLSAQQTIPYLSMHPDGVCKLPGGLYTKTVEYEDINYSVASTEDQTAIFSGWSSFLNYFDSSLPFQLSFINRRSHSRSRYQVNIPKADDNYNSVRDEFTGMLKNQIAKSNNGIERSKYITFGIPAEGIAEARPRLERVEADVMGNFKRLGVPSEPMDGRARLALLHSQMHPGSREAFRFSWKDIPQTGLGTKDFIAPDSLDFRQSRTFRIGQYWGAVSYLQIMASELSDKLLAEILELDAEMTVTMHIQTVDQLKAIKTIKGKISDIGKMKVEEGCPGRVRSRHSPARPHYLFQGCGGAPCRPPVPQRENVPFDFYGSQYGPYPPAAGKRCVYRGRHRTEIQLRPQAAGLATGTGICFFAGPWLQRGRNPARYDHQLHSHLYSFYDKGAPHGWAGPLLWHERTFSQCHHG